MTGRTHSSFKAKKKAATDGPGIQRLKQDAGSRQIYTQHVLAACFIAQSAACRLGEATNHQRYWFVQN